MALEHADSQKNRRSVQRYFLRVLAQLVASGHPMLR
jgi:hypothetical protein